MQSVRVRGLHAARDLDRIHRLERGISSAAEYASPVAESARVRTQVIDAKTRSRAPREVVWGILADGGSWSAWGPWTKSELEREGAPPPGGLGSIKRLSRGRLTLREEVTEFEAPSRYGYRLLSGLPVRNYRAHVTLSEAADGTDIQWHSEFEGRLPGTGWLVRRSLQRAVNDVASRLAHEAQRRAAGNT
jgi:Polyketide cyclase / dehydrase and lipid transport